MTPQQQRIAIAEFCGWTDCHQQHDDGRYYEFDCTGTPPNWSGTRYQRIPDFPNDLYAMHEAEKHLDSIGRWLDYTHALAELVTPDQNNEYRTTLNWTIVWPILSASAAQRAEAFLRTIGKLE